MHVRYVLDALYHIGELGAIICSEGNRTLLRFLLYVKKVSFEDQIMYINTPTYDATLDIC